MWDEEDIEKLGKSAVQRYVEDGEWQEASRCARPEDLNTESEDLSIYSCTVTWLMEGGGNTLSLNEDDNHLIHEDVSGLKKMIYV